MAGLTQAQQDNIRKLLGSRDLTDDQRSRLVRILEMSQEPAPKGTGKFEGVFPETMLTEPAVVGGRQRTVEEIPELEREINRFLETPEGQRVALEATGGTIGSVIPGGIVLTRLVTRFGPRLGQLIFRSLSAGAGQAAGSVAAESIDPSESPARSAALSFGLGATGEVVAPAIGAGVKRGLAPLRPQLEKGAEFARDLIVRGGGVLTPGTAVNNRAIDLLENAAEASLLGGGILTRSKESAREIAQEAVESMAQRFSTNATKEDVGEVILDVLEEGTTAFRATARTLYGRVDELTADVFVDVRPIKRAVEEIAKKSESGLGSPAIRKIARRFDDLEDFIPFSVAQELRSDLLAIGRTGTELVGGKAVGAGKLIGQKMDRQMETAAKSLTGDALDAWRAANAHWKAGKETFNSSFIKALARSDPDVIVSKVVRPNRPALVRKVRNLVDDPERWRQVQGTFINDIIGKSQDLDGVINGNILLRNINRFGDDTLKEIIPDVIERKQFLEVVEALRLVQKPASPEGIGRMAIQLTQMGALGVEMVGQGNAVSRLILVGPAVVATAFTRPSIAKWLTVGLKAPPGSDEAIQASAQLVAAMQKEGLLKQIETQEDQ